MLTPTELTKLCEQYGIRPSKKYGQHYLIQQKPIRDILAAGEVRETDTIVEVGPGFGVLTLPLAAQAGRVLSFEIEQKLRSYWEEQVAEIGEETLQIIWGNALNEFPALAATLPAGYKVLANLPYQITSHMLRTFLEVANKPERIVVMVQKEVAERMCAKPGGMSLLSVAVQYYGIPKIVSTVSKGNFFPSPKVESAIIQITNIQPQTDETTFFRIAKAGFSNKRKQLAKNLATGLQVDRERVNMVLKEITGRADIRAEMLSVDDWKQVQYVLTADLQKV